MERGQYRTPQQTHSGQPPRQPQRRPSQPTHPMNRRRRKNRSKKPWIVGGAVLLTILIVVIVCIGVGGNKKSTRISSQDAAAYLPGTVWADNYGGIMLFGDNGEYAQYLAPMPDIEQDGFVIISTWSIDGDMLTLSDVESNFVLEEDMLYWGKSENKRLK